MRPGLYPLWTAGRRARPLSAFVIGAILAFAFAPWRLWLLAPVCLVALHCFLGENEEKRFSGTAREALTGLCFGAGWMLCGCPWLYLGLYEGSHSKLIALLLVGLAMLFFALHHAAAFAMSAWLAARSGRAAYPLYCLVFFPACWMLAEWLRRAFAYDFPWFFLGESQVPGALLVGWAPVGGVLAISFLLAVCAGALTLLPSAWGRPSRLWLCLGILLVCGATDAMLRQHLWTEAEDGSISAVVLQTMRPAGQKWNGNATAAAEAKLEDVIAHEPGKLIITPELMIEKPSLAVPEAFWNRLHAALERQQSYLLLGIPTADKVEGELHVYNSVLSLGPGGFDLYRKQHLVPAAEHLPFKETLAGFYHAALNFPLQDQAIGEEEWSHPLFAAGYQFAPLICYDAAYGEPAARQAEDADAIVNVSDDGWIDSEAYFAQNEQLAQARALESQHPLLRANNIGYSALIGPDGEIVAAALRRSDTLLHVQFHGRRGATPYMRFGDTPLLSLVALILSAGALNRLLQWRKSRCSAALTASRSASRSASNSASRSASHC